MNSRAGENLASLAVFEIAFYFAYRSGMAAPAYAPSPLWFPDSVLLCALLLRPRHTWWMYIAAQLPIRFLVAVPPDAPVWFLPACFVNDSLKAVLSSSLLLRGTGAGAWFNSVRGFVKYLLIAVILSPALSAVGGALLSGSAFWPSWRQWFLGNALASLVLTPALLCLLQDAPRIVRRTFAQYAEAGLLAVVFVSASYWSFCLDWKDFSRRGILLTLPTPFLIWAAVRFGPLGASAALSIMSGLAMFGAWEGTGPFTLPTPTAGVLSIQMFLVVSSVPILFLAVLRQQQQRTDSALRESEERFRSLINTAPLMVWMSDTTGLCTFVNKPWLEFTGVPIERQLGNGWADRIHADDRERVIRDYFSAFGNRKNFTREYRVQCFDGAYRWILDHGTPRYGSDGDFLGYIGSCLDITNHKEYEERLRRFPRDLMNAQEAERQRIGQELHDDLGQRIVALSFGITHLSQQVREGEGLSASFASLRQQSSDIVQDISRLSHQLRPSVLHTLGLAAALSSLCEVSRNTEDADVVFNQHGELPQSVPWASSIGLYRVAQEALRNALNHSGTDQVTMDLTVTKTGLVVAVTDTGSGFDVNRPSKGLGLQGMAERMTSVDGTLQITSTPRAGTTVTASVPLPGNKAEPGDTLQG